MDVRIARIEAELPAGFRAAARGGFSGGLLDRLALRGRAGAHDRDARAGVSINSLALSLPAGRALGAALTAEAFLVATPLHNPAIAA